MALPAQDFEEYFQQITGQQTPTKEYDLSGDAVSVPTAPKNQNTGVMGPSAPSTSPTSAPKPVFSGAGAPAGSVYNFGELFSPVTKELGKQQQALGSAKTSFETAAGPSRSYEGIGAQGTLSSALTPTGDLGTDKSKIEEGKKLVNAKYSGPAGIDQGTLDTINKAYQALTPQAGSLRTAEGASGLVRTKTHGLTAGEREFESGRLLKNQDYQQAARNVAQQVGDTYSDFLRSQREAADFAKAREAEEKDIAEKSKGFLTEQRTGVEQTLADRMKERQASEDETLNSFDTYMQSGSLEDLAKLVTPEELAQFDNEFKKTAGEAATVKAEIMGRPEYEKIKDVPLMGLSINEHGREKLKIDPRWWKDHTIGMSKKEKAEIKKLAVQRQLELENAGFSPGSAASKNQKSIRQETAKQVGKFSAVDPLYFAEAFGNDIDPYTAPDTRSYVAADLGSEVTRGNTATETERNVFNAVNQMLDVADQIAAEDPFQATQIRNEAQRYYDEAMHEKSMREDALKVARDKETKMVSKARKSVRGARLSKALGKTLGSKVLGSTFAGILKGDPKAVANLPFAMAAAPVDTGTQSNISQSASLVKNPKKQKATKVG